MKKNMVSSWTKKSREGTSDVSRPLKEQTPFVDKKGRHHTIISLLKGLLEFTEHDAERGLSPQSTKGGT